MLLLPLLFALIPGDGLDAPAASPAGGATSPVGAATAPWHWTDWSGDGRLDALGRDAGGAALLLEQLDGGTFVDRTALAGLAEVRWSAAEFADVDRDGRLDLLLLDETGALQIFLQADEGRFLPVPVTTTAQAALEGVRWTSVDALDVQGDGRADVHLAGPAGSVLLTGRGDGSFDVHHLGGAAGGAGGGAAGSVATSPPPALASAPARVPIATQGLGAGTAGILVCAGAIQDVVTQACIEASTIPQLGYLYPISSNWFVSPAGLVGIGTTAPGTRLDVAGVARASRLISTASTGTPPLQIASRTVVPLLNADQVDGLDAAAFRKTASPITGADVLDESLDGADLASGSVGTDELQGNAVTGAKIANGTISASDLGANSVASVHIIDGTVSSSDLAAASVSAQKLQSDSVSSFKILDGSIFGADLSPGAVDTAALATGAVTGDRLAAGAASRSKLALNAVDSSRVEDRSLTGQDLALGSISGSEVQDGTLTAADLAPGAVGSAALANGSVTTATLAGNAVTRQKLAPDAVDSSRVQNGSLTGADLASGTIGSSLLASGAVSSTALASDAVTREKLASDAVDSSRVQDGSLTGADLASGAVTSNALAGGAVTRSKLAANAVDSGRVQDRSLSGADLAVGTVTSAEIQNGTIVSVDLADGSIDSAALAPGAVDASALAAGAVGSGALAPGAVTTIAVLDGSLQATDLGVGAVGGVAIADGSIGDVEIGAGAAIQGTKIDPDFGSQDLRTRGPGTFGDPASGMTELAPFGAALRATGALAGDFVGRVDVRGGGPGDAALTVVHPGGGVGARVQLNDPSATATEPALHVVATGDGAARGVLVESLGLANTGSAFQVIHHGAGPGLDITSGALPLRVDRSINAGPILEARNLNDVEFRVDSSGDVFCDGAFMGGGADYAEWLERADAGEVLEPGDVVAVRGGKVSRSLAGAERFMVVSTSPCLVGNHPDADLDVRDGFSVIAFVGQVPVKVRGECRVGDVLLPSGLGDGVAIARDPAGLRAADLDRVVGTAWGATSGAQDVETVVALVGVGQERAAAAALARLEAELAARDALLVRLVARIEALERR